ncbi:uncharacterized protein N7479_000796 [Penicillium vulpinum]|nr:uncharacterized protein N7479_000796 [Penicillium vulpinum]KAJ5970878.1 hypothetical protein N7479_000796 [Penicillium vulpinum]
MCTRNKSKCEYKETPDKRTRALRKQNQVIPSLLSTSAPLYGSIARRLVDTSQVNLTPSERWYLDLFRRYTSRECAGYVKDDFWQKLVHQVSEQEPAVQHATIAMSAMHWRYARGLTGSGAKADDCSVALSTFPSNLILENDISFPLRQCNKAIASLRQSLRTHATSSAHTEAVLVTCVVLVSLALFQEDTKAATSHVQSGYQLLVEWQKNGFDKSPSGPILMRTFAELQLHQCTFRDPESHMQAEQMSLSRLITTNRQVYGSVDALEPGSGLLVILGWIVAAYYPRGLGKSIDRRFGVNAACLLNKNDGIQETAVERIQMWKSHLETFVMHYAEMLSSQDRHSLRLIEIWTELTYILVDVTNRPEQREMAYDSLLPHFHRVNELGKIYYQSSERMPQFAAKITVMLAIFFVAQKCRDWHTRREALHLIRSRRRREGIWTSSGSVATLEHLIKEESAGLTPEDVIPMAARVDTIHIERFPEQGKLRLWYHRFRSHESTDSTIHGIWKTVLLSS